MRIPANRQTVNNALHLHVCGDGRIRVMELIDGNYFECLADNWDDVLLTLEHVEWLGRADVKIFVR